MTGIIALIDTFAFILNSILPLLLLGRLGNLLAGSYIVGGFTAWLFALYTVVLLRKHGNGGVSGYIFSFMIKGALLMLVLFAGTKLFGMSVPLFGVGFMVVMVVSLFALFLARAKK